MDHSQSEEKSSNEFKTQIENFFSRTLIRLESRMESVEVKVVSLSKVVRLLQQYSERKDEQYERQSNYLQTFQSRLIKIQELEAHLSSNILRFNELSNSMQNHSLRLDQLNRAIQEKQTAVSETEERLNYEMHEISKKIEKLETGLLQQIREGSKKQEENNGRVIRNQGNYLVQELNFRMSQLENSSKNDFQRIKAKLDKCQVQLKRLSKQENSYGLERTERDKQRNKLSDRKKSQSLLKRVKSK